MLGGPPCFTEREHIWLGQADEEGQPEVMDEAKEEATIEELLGLAVATGEHLTVSLFLTPFFFSGALFIYLFVCLRGAAALPHEEPLP